MISFTIKTTTTSRNLTPSFSLARSLHRSISPSIPQTSQNIVSFYSNLITHCLSSKSLTLAGSIHAHLLKTGLSRNTFLGNRLVDLYSRLSDMCSSFQAFHDIPNKNSITWNLLVMGFFKCGDLGSARRLFDKMPERDIISWNSMISGYLLNGLVEYALPFLLELQNAGMRPNGFTFSIVVSCVRTTHHGKQIHGSIIRSGLNLSNLVLSNSLIDMYGRLGLVNYAFGVFLMMEELDVISWNSMISACEKSCYWEWAFDYFGLMRAAGFLPDQFTISTMVAVCANLKDLENGEKVFAQCIRMGFLSNTIVSSAIIDMFAKCDRIDDSAQLFLEMPHWDSALCNSMISGYSRHGFAEEALSLFVLTLRENFMPTEFTFGSILSSTSCLVTVDQGFQVHSLVIKFGLESDVVVASSLVNMYMKSGLVDNALCIFSKMPIRDIVCWNAMIIGFAQNGRGVEALRFFEELCKQGPSPDRITLAGVLSACGYGGLVDEGLSIFGSMEEKYGVTRGGEHYTWMVDMLGRAGKLAEAMDMVEMMPHGPTASIWGVLLRACLIHGDMEVAERVAERVMELKPHTSLPYLVLARMYATRGRWESIALVRKAMKERGVKKAIGCSWIGIKNHVFAFKANEILHCGGESLFSMLRLLVWEMWEEGYVSQSDVAVADGGDE